MNLGTDSTILAAYLRLSLADGDLENGKNESNSIANQRKLIRQYLLSHPDLERLEYTEYVDDGYSGTNTARPSFQSMISKARNGEINCIIVKDMSRFSRNYLTLGDYVEQILPVLGVRFIAINDHYDSKEQISYLQSMSIALHGLVYAYYSKDLSKKKGLNIKARMKKGTYIAKSPYGYKTNWKQYRFEIDPEAAEVVRLIFDLVLTGNSPNAITQILNECQIPTPYVYAQLHPDMNQLYLNSKTKVPLWSSPQVKRILHNETYTGKLIMNKTYMNKPDQIKQRARPKEEYIIREHAHEAIISQNDFDMANQMLRRNKAKSNRSRQSPPYEPSALAGRLFCGHCGLIMEQRKKSMTAVCKYHRRYQTVCNDTTYSLPVIEDHIYYKLMPFLQEAVAEKKEQEKAVRQARADLKECQRQIMFLKRRQEELLHEKRRLFEAFSEGSLSADRYISNKADFRQLAETIQTELEARMSEEETLLSVTVDPDLSTLAQKAGIYLTESCLTRDMVTDFIESVEACGIDDYHITWRYPALFHHLKGRLQRKREDASAEEIEQR